MDSNDENNKQPKKLKPVLYERGRYGYRRMDKFKQNLLLKAMQVTSDPNKMRKLAGMKTIAEVHRTLDKLAIRREYHEALAKQGIDLEIIVGGIKEIAEGGSSDRVRLDGYKTLLKSLGLDEYKEGVGDDQKSWEELVKEVGQEEIDSKDNGMIEEYEVNPPEIPEEEKKRMEDEHEVGKSLYD
ncbi:MAG: hypothetical protein ACOCT9_02970 [archaeon]